jgi:hypothetical protein
MNGERNSPGARLNPVTIATWRAAVADDSGKRFAVLVHEDVILEGRVLASPITGREHVRNAIQQSSRLCNRLQFTHETQSTNRTYFEWEGTALGSPVWGINVAAGSRAKPVGSLNVPRVAYTSIIGIDVPLRFLDGGTQTVSQRCGEFEHEVEWAVVEHHARDTTVLLERNRRHDELVAAARAEISKLQAGTQQGEER